MEILTCDDPFNRGCSWSGVDGELVAKTDSLDDRDFKYCPYCGGDLFEIDEEDD